MISVRDLNSGGKSQSSSNSGGLNLGNQSQQKQEVVFGKSAVTQKTSPTSPQNSSPQKSANGGSGNQQAQVKIRLNSPSIVDAVLFFRCCSSNFFFQHVDNEFLEKFIEEMRRVKIIVKGHERRIKTLEERLSQYEAPIDDLDD